MMKARMAVAAIGFGIFLSSLGEFIAKSLTAVIDLKLDLAGSLPRKKMCYRFHVIQRQTCSNGIHAAHDLILTYLFLECQE